MIDFTTGKSDDYSEYRTYFLPRGICTVDSSGKYVIMKSLDSYESYIEFTVDCPATLIATAASTGHNNTSNYILTDASGNIIVEKSNRVQATGTSGTTFIYTITEPGTYRFVCTSTDRVGRLMSMKIAENHTYTIESTIQNPTCTEAGEKALACMCGKYITEIIPAYGHSFVDGICSVCQEADATHCNHTNNTVVVTAPTCTTGGYTTYTCTNCGTIRKDNETAALGHSEVIDAAVEPTCNATGLTEGKHCETCNVIIVAQQSIAKVSHDYGDSENCLVCGAKKPVAGTQIHNFTESGATDIEEFFTITGNLRGDNTLKLQSNAGKISFTPSEDGKVTVYFIGATSLKINGVENENIETVDSITTLSFNVTAGTTYEITKGSGEAIVNYIEYSPGEFVEEPHVHSHSAVVTAPTCKDKGYTTYTCSCGDTYIADEVAATGKHTYVDGVCTVCGSKEPVSGDKEVFKYDAAGSKIENNTVIYSGTAFSVKLLGGGATPTSNTAIAEDGTEFSACLLPGGSGRSYTITAKKSGTIYIYVTITNGSFASKTATVTYGDKTINITSQKGVAYKLELEVVAGQTYTITPSAERLGLYGVVFE